MKLDWSQSSIRPGGDSDLDGWFAEAYYKLFLSQSSIRPGGDSDWAKKKLAGTHPRSRNPVFALEVIQTMGKNCFKDPSHIWSQSSIRPGGDSDLEGRIRFLPAVVDSRNPVFALEVIQTEI